MPRGQTPKQRQFRKETKPIRQTIRQLKQEVNIRPDNEKLNDLRDQIQASMEKFMGPVSGVGMSLGAGNVMKKELKKALKKEKDAARPAPFNDGGEVMDLTTEVDVE